MGKPRGHNPGCDRTPGTAGRCPACISKRTTLEDVAALRDALNLAAGAHEKLESELRVANRLHLGSIDLTMAAQAELAQAKFWLVHVLEMVDEDHPNFPTEFKDDLVKVRAFLAPRLGVKNG